MLKKKGKLQSQTWWSSTGSFFVVLASIATLLLQNQEGIQLAILSIIPPELVPIAKGVLAVVFAVLAYVMRAKTLEGREKAATTGERLEGWYRY